MGQSVFVLFEPTPIGDVNKRTAILCMDKFLHHTETMGNHCLSEFVGELSFQGLLGGAGFCPSTVGVPLWTPQSESTPLAYVGIGDFSQ